LDTSQINIQIAKELNITPVLENIQDYKRKWLQHVNQMPCNGLPRLTKKYTPKGKRKTTEETSGCVRPGQVSKWPNFLIAT
jgi:hypothetical protein